MRWFRVRKANIPADLRQTLEQHGVGTMQQFLVFPDRQFVYRGIGVTPYQYREAILAWLTEQYDRAERAETWNLTMEAAIVALVVFEVILGIVQLKQK